MRRSLVVAAAIVLVNLSLLAPIRGSGSNVVEVVIPRGTAHALYASNFYPPKVTVVIGVNNTVRWVNLDDHEHMVDALKVNSGGMEMNATAMGPLWFHGDLNRTGATFTHTFVMEGNYTYRCPPHPWMVGYVEVVRPGGGAG